MTDSPQVDFDKVKAIGMSDTQSYKQAGNSIVVNVLEGIFRNLYLEEEIKMAENIKAGVEVGGMTSRKLVEMGEKALVDKYNKKRY